MKTVAVPLLNASRERRLGYEVGKAATLMELGFEVVEGQMHCENDEQLHLLAHRFGYALDWRRVDDQIVFRGVKQ